MGLEADLSEALRPRSKARSQGKHPCLVGSCVILLRGNGLPSAVAEHEDIRKEVSGHHIAIRICGGDVASSDGGGSIECDFEIFDVLRCGGRGFVRFVVDEKLGLGDEAPGSGRGPDEVVGEDGIQG